MRTYQGIPERLEAFHGLFNTQLRGIFERHGTRFVGRWQSLEGGRIVAIFEYDSVEHYQQSDAAVRSDPEYQIAMRQALEAGPLYASFEDVMMFSTSP